MKQTFSNIGLFLLMFGFISYSLMIESCKHDPLLTEMVMPIDTMPVDTMPIDTMPVDTMGIPCDSEKVYFVRDILPIFNSNCALSGCHDEQSAEGGIVLNGYSKIIATSKIEPFNLNESELYEVITETDDEKRMPPPPNERLTANQVQMIVKWILQGADSLVCDDLTICDTMSVSYSQSVSPILETHCVGCHGLINPSGGITLKTYDGVRTVSLSGQFVGAVTHQSGYSAMPKNLPKLYDCDIDQIKAWVNQGALNN